MLANSPAEKDGSKAAPKPTAALPAFEPLKGRSFFLDVDIGAVKKRMAAQICTLGGRVVEHFDVTIITHVVSSKTGSQQSAPPSQTKAPATATDRRIQQILKAAQQRVQGQPRVDIIHIAHNFGKTVWSTGKCQQILDNYAAQQLGTSPRPGPSPAQARLPLQPHVQSPRPEPQSWVSNHSTSTTTLQRLGSTTKQTIAPNLAGPFAPTVTASTASKSAVSALSLLNMEIASRPVPVGRFLSYSSSARPIPTFAASTVPVQLAAEPERPVEAKPAVPTMCIDDIAEIFGSIRKEYSDPATIPQLHLDNTPNLPLFLQYDEETLEAERAKIAKRKADRTLQADEENRRKLKKVNNEKDLFHRGMRQQSGICETCGQLFDDFEHLKEPKHTGFAKNPANYQAIDEFFASLKN